VASPDLAGKRTPHDDGVITLDMLTRKFRPGMRHFGHAVEADMPPQNQHL